MFLLGLINFLPFSKFPRLFSVTVSEAAVLKYSKKKMLLKTLQNLQGNRLRVSFYYKLHASELFKIVHEVDALLVSNWQRNTLLAMVNRLWSYHSEILRVEISKKLLIQQKNTKTFYFQVVTSR